MIKLLTLFLVFVYLSPAQSCYHCEITEFCLENGAVYDRLSTQVCNLLKKSKKHNVAVQKCKEIHSTADLWVPNDRIAQALANLYPGILSTGNPTLTWINSITNMLGEISGSGYTVSNVPWTARPKRKRIICCIEAKKSLFTSNSFRARFARITKSFTKKSPPKTEYCTNPTTRQIPMLAPVAAYETNSETESKPVIKLFTNEEYNSAEEHKNPTYVIQYLQTKNTVRSVIIRSIAPLLDNFQIYAGSKFEEGKPITEYTKIADRINFQSLSDSRNFTLRLQEYNCYNFIILYVPRLQTQLRLNRFVALVEADGRPQDLVGGK